MSNLLALIISYLLGSLSCAVLLSKCLKLPDPRKTGSGNPGATNILRIAGKNQALAVLVGDALKGFVAILLARILGVHGFMLGLAGLSVVLGHVFPIFHKFKGGKGVATMLGTLLMLNFWVGLFAVAVWVVIAFLLRYASLSSLVAAVCAPIFILIFGDHQYAFPVLLIAALVIWRHWENIEKLRSGNEDKMDLGKKKTTPAPNNPSEKP
jgi:acyl phosphate:glycerol-3-phosphate acyltransferase